MKTVHKFDLWSDDNTVTLPAGAELLTVQMQHDSPRLWALVDTDVTEQERRIIRFYGTGHFINPALELRYLATVQMEGGALVFHAFEVLS